MWFLIVLHDSNLMGGHEKGLCKVNELKLVTL